MTDIKDIQPLNDEEFLRWVQRAAGIRSSRAEGKTRLALLAIVQVVQDPFYLTKE